MDVNFVIFDPESVTVTYVLGLQSARLYVNTSNSLVSSSPIAYNIVFIIVLCIKLWPVLPIIPVMYYIRTSFFNTLQ